MVDEGNKTSKTVPHWTNKSVKAVQFLGKVPLLLFNRWKGLIYTGRGTKWGHEKLPKLGQSNQHSQTGVQQPVTEAWLLPLKAVLLSNFICLIWHTFAFFISLTSATIYSSSGKRILCGMGFTQFINHSFLPTVQLHSLALMAHSRSPGKHN